MDGYLWGFPSIWGTSTKKMKTRKNKGCPCSSGFFCSCNLSIDSGYNEKEERCMLLKGKVALVTGAGGGLGRKMAEKLGEQGASIVASDVSEEQVNLSVTELRSKGFTVMGDVTDVTDRQQVKKSVADALQHFGKIDILVNNAGGSLYTPKALEEVEEQHWDIVLDVNLKGTFLFAQEVVPVMKANGGGKMINVASLAGRTASIVTGVQYGAAKGGIISFTRRLAKEVGPYNINVNCIAPGVIISGERIKKIVEDLSPQEYEKLMDDIPLRRLGTIDDPANAVVFLSSEWSQYFTGAVLDINGGRFMG